MGEHDKENFTFVLDYGIHPEAYKQQLKRHLVQNRVKRRDEHAHVFGAYENDREGPADRLSQRQREQGDFIDLVEPDL